MSSSKFSDASKNNQIEEDSEYNLFVLASIIIKQANFIIYSICIVIVFTIVLLLLLPNKYTSTASILPSGSPDQLSDFKSLAGLGTISNLNENPSALFPAILKSLHIAKALLSEKYSFHVDGLIKTLTLQEYFDEYDFDELVLKLADISSFVTDKKTNVIHLAVETKYSALSQALVAKYLFELENYNLYKRRSKANENEVYLAKQLGVIKEELSVAEDELERFQAANSNWRISSNSEIIRALSRLDRSVQIKSSVFLFLTQEFERAKFDAQKDVPIIQILDSPSLPTQLSSPRRTMILLLTIIISSFLIIFMVIIYELFRKHSRESEKELIDEIKNDLQKTFPTISKYIFKKESIEIDIT